MTIVESKAAVLSAENPAEEVVQLQLFGHGGSYEGLFAVRAGDQYLSESKP